jgi:hypothetical protein
MQASSGGLVSIDETGTGYVSVLDSNVTRISTVRASAEYSALLGFSVPVAHLAVREASM